MSISDDRALWRLVDPGSGLAVECVMISCCSGAELQLRRTDPRTAETDVVLRELYPGKPDLYERARMLHARYAREFQPGTGGDAPELDAGRSD